MTDVLRVIDFGRVSPLRSQTLWHAVAYGVSAGEPATLSFARPSAPYVCLGYHRDLAEVDLGYCQAEGLPVYRRMVGGGPVYLDDGQLFFQICLPAGAVPAARLDALRMLLAPAVAAFRAAGVDARLDDDGEICVGDRKICGHGAGQIEDAVVVCGNLIERFNHQRATRVLALPGPAQRAETLRLMRRYVTATPADPAAFQAAAITAYASALGLAAAPGELTGDEQARLAELDARFSDRDWLAGPTRPQAAGAPARQVKVRAGVWTAGGFRGGAQIVVSVVRGHVDRAWLRADGLNGMTQAAESALAGVPVTAVPEVLARFGDPGRQLAAAFAAADGKRL
ncbi:MAG: biotin/lipoate A/B protein ligase family protein [Gemmatimonadota bacterium]